MKKSKYSAYMVYRKSLGIVFIFLLRSLIGFTQSDAIRQLQLNTEKLTQLKLMLAEIKNGHQQLAQHYDAIRNSSLKNYLLHKSQLDALSKPGDKVLQSPAITRIRQMAGAAMHTIHDVQQLSTQCFSPAEILQIRQNANDLTLSIQTLLQQLDLLLKDNSLQSSEAQRLSALQDLEKDMEKRLVVCMRFEKQLEQYTQIKKQQKRDNAVLKKLYGQ